MKYDFAKFRLQNLNLQPSTGELIKKFGCEPLIFGVVIRFSMKRRVMPFEVVNTVSIRSGFAL